LREDSLRVLEEEGYTVIRLSVKEDIAEKFKTRFGEYAYTVMISFSL
jgi:hypothetical protein